jgi:fructose-bisphosphate aldolase class 1
MTNVYIYISNKTTALRLVSLHQRQVLLSHPDLGQYLSGAILHEETFGQKHSCGKTFVEVLTAKGVLVGVKTDQGLQPLDNSLVSSHLSFHIIKTSLYTQHTASAYIASKHLACVIACSHLHHCILCTQLLRMCAYYLYAG